jgi:hypothetical protein
MTKFVVDYPFDELKIIIAGVKTGMFYGNARLVEDSNPGEFYVERIKFDDGGTTLYRRSSSAFADEFSKELFTRIARVIEEDGHAADFFAGKLEESQEPDPDYERDRRRDDAAYFAHA